MKFYFLDLSFQVLNSKKGSWAPAIFGSACPIFERTGTQLTIQVYFIISVVLLADQVTHARTDISVLSQYLFAQQIRYRYIRAN